MLRRQPIEILNLTRYLSSKNSRRNASLAEEWESNMEIPKLQSTRKISLRNARLAEEWENNMEFPRFQSLNRRKNACTVKSRKPDSASS